MSVSVSYLLAFISLLLLLFLLLLASLLHLLPLLPHRLLLLRHHIHENPRLLRVLEQVNGLDPLVPANVPAGVVDEVAGLTVFG